MAKATSRTRAGKSLDRALSKAGTCSRTEARRFIADRRVEVPARTGEALGRLLSGDDVAPRDLPGLSEDDAVALVRRLLREGVVVPASPW